MLNGLAIPIEKIQVLDPDLHMESFPMNGMMKVILDNGLEDEDFIKKNEVLY